MVSARESPIPINLLENTSVFFTLNLYRWTQRLNSSLAWRANLASLHFVLASVFFVGTASFGQTKVTNVLDPKQYTIPIYFFPKDNGVNLPDQVLEYELDGNELTIGKTKYNSRTIRYELHKEKAIVSKEGSFYMISFSWPKGFLTKGSLLMRTNVEKKTLYSLDKIPEGKVEGDTLTIEGKISEKEIAAWEKQTPLKFCVEDKESKKSFCSQDYIIKDIHEEVNLRVSRQEYVSEVVLMNKEHVPKVGKYPAKLGVPLSGKVIFKNGAEFDFETTALPFEPVDIVESEKHQILFKGKGGKPLGGDPNVELWTARMDKDKPYFYLSTDNDILLKQELEITRTLPLEKKRPFLKKGTRDSTYQTHVPLHAYEAGKLKIASQEFSTNMTSDLTFDWDYQAQKRGQLNRSHLSLLEDDKTYVGYYDMYKGYAIELSGRATGAYNAQGSLVLGEVLATGWLEQFLKNENTILSLQHWGASVRYLATIVAPTDTANGNKMTLTGYNADVKYRFTPGIWNQDQSFGVMGAYQQVSFESASGSMVGGGAFWVLPMPSLFDKLFNKLKWFRYPKVIDAEVEWFPLSITSSMTLGTTFNAIVHGKLFLKPTFFVEGAVGMKQYNYTLTNTAQVQLSTAFASGGLGIDF